MRALQDKLDNCPAELLLLNNEICDKHHLHRLRAHNRRIEERRMRLGTRDADSERHLYRGYIEAGE